MMRRKAGAASLACRTRAAWTLPYAPSPLRLKSSIGNTAILVEARGYVL